MTDKLKPRGVLSLIFRRSGIWLLIPMVMGGIVGMVGFYTLQDASEFAGQGQTATAEVISTQLRKSRGPGSGNNSEIPEASVRFTVRGNEVFAASRISPRLFESIQPGDLVDIRYLPDDPRQIEIEPGTNLKAALILLMVVLACLAIWGLVFVRSVRYAREAVHVRDKGVRSQVPITDHKAPMFTSDKKPETCLVWRDNSGKECRSLPIRQDRARSLRVGKSIAIYELPDRNLNSYWEGDVGQQQR